MKRNFWMNLVMAVLVAGLFMTVSCAKKTMVTDASTIENKADDADAKAREAALKAKELEEQLARERAAKAAAAKERFVNQNIHFEFDSSQLSSMAMTLLKEKAEWLQENPGVAVTVEGHCDDRGTTVYNLALGERRAMACKNYLVDLGIAADRLNMVSYGEEKPLDPAKTEEAYAKNRRAQFVLN